MTFASALKNQFKYLVGFSLALLVATPVGSADIFSSRKPSPVVIQKQGYNVVFGKAHAGSVKVPKTFSEKKKWAQYVYKITLLETSLLEQRPPWIKIDFFDQNSFRLLSDLVHTNEFVADKEFYGVAWAPDRVIEDFRDATVKQVEKSELLRELYSKRRRIEQAQRLLDYIPESERESFVLTPVVISGKEFFRQDLEQFDVYIDEEQQRIDTEAVEGQDEPTEEILVDLADSPIQSVVDEKKPKRYTETDVLKLLGLFEERDEEGMQEILEE